MKPGFYCYIGKPKTGKSTLALKHACELAGQAKMPLVILEMQPQAKPGLFDEYHQADSVEDLLKRGTYKKQDCRYTPKDRKDFIATLRALREIRNRVILIDEVAAIRNVEEVIIMARGHRHITGSLLFTTQNVTMDLGSQILAQGPTVYIFQVDTPPAVRLLCAHYGKDPEVLAKLPRGSFEILDLSSG